MVERSERATIAEDVGAHPGALKIAVQAFGLGLLPAVGDGLELVGDDREDPVLAPHRAKVALVGVVLFPDEEQAALRGDLGHAFRVLFLNGLERAGNGVGTTPGLQPDRARVGGVEQRLHDQLGSRRRRGEVALGGGIAHDGDGAQGRGRRVRGIVLHEVRVDLGVGGEVGVDPVVARPFMALPAVLRAGGDEALDIPLVGVEKEANERTLVVDLSIARDDDAWPLSGGRRNPGQGRDQKEKQRKQTSRHDKEGERGLQARR